MEGPSVTVARDIGIPASNSMVELNRERCYGLQIPISAAGIPIPELPLITPFVVGADQMYGERDRDRNKEERQE